ncbi:Early endosome antigen 1 [Ogataea parapolymorpha DL-1]|uniref:Early endosome antigen 1 n=1 Tax=Ogataea parapolymorpha (strain ATCC 26012 / BCRC 20466 / JCM 22074 / NRRL Y-7560 / DL-1) TaxID=871575 RepID=W1QJ33_OGAPD|nr:Early endosome antigen 1 [Ogataea parapolymorpha DL-1]ESX01857.1 Early endosome antigen 1 [Ogataea parapolymorpha DL-1]
MLQRNMAQKTSIENGSPVKRGSITNSSFDETFDVLNDDNRDDRVFRGADILPDFSDNDTEPIVRDAKNNVFVEDGSNLLRKQHDQVQNLQEENLNLRIELLTLRKYLEGQPKDKVDIINQNVELSQENVNLRDRVEALQQQLRDEDKENLRSHNKKQLRHYEQEIEKYEVQLRDFEHVKRELEAERQRAEKNEDRALDLEQEVHTLMDEKDQLQASREKLEAELRALHSRLEDLQDNIDDQSHSKSKIDDLVDNLNDANKFIDEIGDKLEQKTSENTELKRKIESLESKNEELKSKNHRLSEILDQLKDEIRHLEDRRSNSTIRKLEDENRDLRQEVEELFNRHQQDTKTITNLQLELRKLESETADQMGNESYIDAVEEEKNTLYDNIIKLNEKLKDAEHKCKRLQRELEAKGKDLEDRELELQRLRKLDRGSSRNDMMDTVEELQNKLIQERNKFVNEIDKMDSKFVSEKNELYDTIEKLQREKLEIIEDFEKIQREYNNLLDKMHDSRASSELQDLERDFKKLSFSYATKCQELEDVRYESDSLVRDLKDELSYKEAEMKRLQSRIEQMTAEIDKQTGLHKSENKLQLRELMEDKRLLEEKYSDCLRENNRLRRQLESIKARDDLEKPDSLEMKELRRECDTLKTELSMKTKELAELNWKLDDALEERKQLVESISSLDSDQQRVSEENLKLTTELEDLKYKLNSRGLRKELELKDMEIKKLVDDYNEMKNDLLNRYDALRKEKNALSQELDEMRAKLERSKAAQEVLLSKQMKKTEYPLSPVSPQRSPRSRDHSSDPRVNLLESQKQLFKIKLQQYKDCNSDLKFVANFLTRELESKERVVASLQKLGGISKEKPQRTFRAVALAVLASVRFKTRLEQLKQKMLEEQHVKKAIGRYKEETVDV